MKLRFIGQHGSMNLRFGQIYKVSVESKDDETTMMTRPVRCPYSSDTAFWQNWAHPDEDLRSLMEARGRALRRVHIDRREFENTPIPEKLPAMECLRTDVHGSHNWSVEHGGTPHAWCPGRVI